jgi:hypothetical protein
MVNPAITKTSLDLPVIASTQKVRGNLIVKSEIASFHSQYIFDRRIKVSISICM